MKYSEQHVLPVAWDGRRKRGGEEKRGRGSGGPVLSTFFRHDGSSSLEVSDGGWQTMVKGMTRIAALAWLILS